MASRPWARRGGCPDVAGDPQVGAREHAEDVADGQAVARKPVERHDRRDGGVVLPGDLPEVVAGHHADLFGGRAADVGGGRAGRGVDRGEASGDGERQAHAEGRTRAQPVGHGEGVDGGAVGAGDRPQANRRAARARRAAARVARRRRAARRRTWPGLMRVPSRSFQAMRASTVSAVAARDVVEGIAAADDVGRRRGGWGGSRGRRRRVPVPPSPPRWRRPWRPWRREAERRAGPKRVAGERRSAPSAPRWRCRGRGRSTTGCRPAARRRRGGRRTRRGRRGRRAGLGRQLQDLADAQPLAVELVGPHQSATVVSWTRAIDHRLSPGCTVTVCAAA